MTEKRVIELTEREYELLKGLLLFQSYIKVKDISEEECKNLYDKLTHKNLHSGDNSL